MIEASLAGLSEELAALEAEERQVSAEGRRLHQQIDGGFATEMTRAREREVSQRRRALHHQIDSLRASLGLPVGPQPTSGEPGLEKIWPAFGSQSLLGASPDGATDDS